MSYGEQQILKTENRLANNAHPNFTPTDFQGGQWGAGNNTDWRAGFFNGSEWIMYEWFGNNANGWLAKADGRTRDFSAEVSRPQTHDIGFKTIATYGLGFRLTNLEEFRPKVFAGANTLAARYSTQYGVTRSWDDTNGDFRVIIDNMMNLEVFFQAAQLTSNTADRDRWLNMAVTHAVNTERNHIRDSADPNVDGSTCHVYYYNLGVCHTGQGISDSSTWSRGQAWGLYGFTMAYQYARRYPQYATETALFLATAQRTTDLFLRRLAEPKNGDMVPLHDFDAAAGQPKDSSAAAIAASALVDLSRIPAVPVAKRAQYKAAAENILDRLRNTSGSNLYRSVATAGDLTKESILLRATTSYNAPAGNQQVERSLSYADYFFLEALVRYQDTYGTTPRAPSFLSGVRSAGQVALTWTGTRGADIYTIKRADTLAGPFLAIGTSDAPSYTDTTVLPGFSYYYVVTATNLAPAESGPSNTASFVYVVPPPAPTGLVATPGNSQVALSWSAVSGAQSYTAKKGTAMTGPFTVVQAGITSTSYTVTGLTNGTVYYFVVSASNSGGEGPDSSPVSATPTIAWATQDVGAVGAVGSWSESSGTHTVRGSGVDIWGNADEFRSVHYAVSGNATITARVTGIQNTDPYAKAGVMMRENLTAGSRNLYAHITPTAANGFRLQSRATTGGITARQNVGASVVPSWVRLVRSGNNFTGFYSTNGTTWTAIGPTLTVTMPTTLYLGMAVTSHLDGTLNTSTFDSVTITTP
ncbi:MAG TPA: fibronectin type III domain-containing protein [Polyangia bacterium]|nr:fibronectin type III domain-containing protein [Polyangia bacterium]